ncbi:phosphoribosyltransferase family protein [Leifsonia sp. NPDC058194]|uniref:phosphoribosyltransferase family protein n=1 Tax=Leifsonia sp. NPDC058194 TaxID=3346374 RepID=UPI0036DCFFA9
MTPSASPVRARMADLFEWVTDDGTRLSYVEFQRLWRDPEILSGIGPLLAAPFAEAAPTVVIGPPSSGHLLGPLVAAELGAGFGAVAKNPVRLIDSDNWITVTTPPDYRDRHLTMGLRRGVVTSADRVLAVDDVADTGSQLLALKRLVEHIGATWVGSSVVLDLLPLNTTRRELRLQSVFHSRDL